VDTMLLGTALRQPRNRRKRRAMAAAVLGFTVDEFCERFDISRSFFYKLRREGRGPKIMKIGRLTRISPEAADDFRRRIEAETATA
jgi:excisionase family DNA binding protein